MVFVRRKRVTDPFDDEAKARLVGGDYRKLSYDSSGSEHSGTGDGDGDENSPCLSELVHNFLEDNGNEDESVGDEFDSERVDSVSECMDSVVEALMLTATNNVSDPYRALLHSHVLEASERFAFMREQNASSFRRSVLSFLRERGHNAAICKTRWDSSSGVVTAGNYEFIDVVQSGPSTWRQNRYFVDLDFAVQFEIARASNSYSEVLSNVPRIFVGTAEELKRTVLALCEAAKRCFRSKGLSVPPWRKNRFMQEKWFGPYKRTTNPVHGNPVPAVVDGVTGAKCRFVGFNDAVLEARRGGVFVD
ncbi:hypothetical protein HN51_027388 [Arachis hypogaea]|uniref:DUF506 family protein n=1 Tax=Arachis hypogaea TaxID=3818 RepID=A0A445BN92_ARAHY|nr:uncharacterized protein LOC112708835 [Arachis hypogaea]QHO33724.1 uncharacterized protein DS421_9g260740 [Arachis hypogaea]RYR40148.1 hypothetical protein Ahy_A09g045832 [Arachis hypogaea]